MEYNSLFIAVIVGQWLFSCNYRGMSITSFSFANEWIDHIMINRDSGTQMTGYAKICLFIKCFLHWMGFYAHSLTRYIRKRAIMHNHRLHVFVGIIFIGMTGYFGVCTHLILWLNKRLTAADVIDEISNNYHCWNICIQISIYVIRVLNRPSIYCIVIGKQMWSDLVWKAKHGCNTLQDIINR